MLELQKISASYGSHQVLFDVSFTVDPGEIVGIVGPNGAGKTTLFKILARIIKEYEGSVVFEGNQLSELSSSKIGYLADAPFQFKFFTPAEMLFFERAIRFPELSEEEVFEMMHILGLDDHMGKQIQNLSQGLKKRVALAAAFLGNPSVIILDEPLNSIDIQTVIILKQLIQKALSLGAIILLSSHVLDFFDGLIKRIIFLDQGTIRYMTSDDIYKAEELYVSLFLSNHSDSSDLR